MLFETGVLYLKGGAWQGDFARISEGQIPLPVGVSEAIQARVRGLNDDAQEALRLAAVLGREFDFDLLNSVWGRGEEATLEALDDLLRHRLIEEGTGSMGRDYAFTHHKIQEVVYAGMQRRRQQHYVTKKEGKPALKFVMVEDQFADRKTILHNRTWPFVEP